MQLLSNSGRTEATGVRIGGAGGAVLTLMFFMPWFSACNINITGKDLAFGLELNMGMLGNSSSGAPIYPWVALVLVCGIAGAVLGLLSLTPMLGTPRNQAILMLVPGTLACLLLGAVVLGYMRESSSSDFALVRMEYGLPASVLGALVMFGGPLIDLRQNPAMKSAAAGASAAPPAAYSATWIPAAAPPPPSAPIWPASSGARLQCIAGALQGQSFALTGDRIAIGRSADNAICIRGTQVSRLHAVIRHAQGTYFLQDQQSTLGTQLNGRAIEAAPLKPGDTITIGDTVFEFRLG